MTLQDMFESCETAAIACSGGVDSMTLAFVAHRAMTGRIAIFHALSPAVPRAATDRVRRYAATERWNLRILDAGEFRDDRYRANPADRCFFCKSNLYGTLSREARGTQLLSGTNVDDLRDWRPGLRAAEVHEVRHPYVEVGMRKSHVRELAAMHGLHDVADLPSAPCLSSRVETGIRIDAVALQAIDEVETMLRDRLKPRTVRCRLRSEGLVIELDEEKLNAIPDAVKDGLAAEVKDAFAHAPDTTVSFRAYVRGSAFLRAALR